MDLSDHGSIESSKYSTTDTEESDRNGSSEESGSSEHLSKHLELDDEAGSSEHSSEGSRTNKHSDTFPEVINRSGGIESDHFEINVGWGSNNLFNGSGSSNKQSEVIQEETDRIENDVLVSTEKPRLSSSSSSSSSNSSTDDQFQVDIKLPKSRSGISDEDTQQSLKDKHHVSGSSTSESENCQNGSAGPRATSQVSTVTHETTVTQSPPIQVMERLGEFDPYRIPSSVFARSKSTNPADWSIASNESLFSIQVGNNSFSRDHILSLKSGELFKSGEFIAFSPSLIAPAVDSDKKSAEANKSEETLVSDDAVKNKTGASAEKKIGQKPTHPMVSWNSNVSNHSDHSETSLQSFAFPIIKKKKKKKKQKKCACPSCYCSNCSWAFCYCKWPSCKFRWPSCICKWPSCNCRWPSCNCRWPSCNCRWPSCYCSKYSFACCYGWNCSIKRWCCHFSTIFGDEKHAFKKEIEEQQEHPLASTKASKSSCCNCWSWFPSWKWRWHWHCCQCSSCKCCC